MIIVIPIPIYGRGFINKWILDLFSKPVFGLAKILNLNNQEPLYGFYTDTVYLLILLFYMTLVGLIIGFFMKKKLPNQVNKTTNGIHVFLVYYLAWIFLIYGFSKVFGIQFPSPDSNILFTEFGQLEIDLLYWSTMGLSKTYTTLTGLVEVFISILLLFRRTRLLGLILFIIVVLQIVLINFSFDITVKTFSILLLILGIYLIYPQLKSLVKILINTENIQLPKLESITIHKKYRYPLKFFVIGCMVFTSFYPHYQSYQFNKLNLNKPLFYGAYQVEEVKINEKIIPPSNWKFEQCFVLKYGNFLVKDKEQNQMSYPIFFLNKTMYTENAEKYGKSMFYFEKIDWSFYPTQQLIIAYGYDTSFIQLKKLETEDLSVLK